MYPEEGLGAGGACPATVCQLRTQERARPASSGLGQLSLHVLTSPAPWLLAKFLSVQGGLRRWEVVKPAGFSFW